MTNEKQKEFEVLARPLIKFLNDNYHPHVTVIITPDSAELLEGVIAIQTKDYIRDWGGKIVTVNSDFEIGRQPCGNFKPQLDSNGNAMWDNRHECYKCGGLVSFCLNCYKDHHAYGYETCTVSDLKQKLGAKGE